MSGEMPVSLDMADETSSLRRLTATGGVEITDIDLARPLTPSAKTRILDLFATHPILVFPNQHLNREQQYEFTLNFGEIEDQHVGRHQDAVKYGAVHTLSNLDKDGNPSGALPERGNYFWHSDKSYHDVPSLLTMLHAVTLPPVGGATQFANTELAYAALPDAIKHRIEGVRVIHSWETSRTKSGSAPATAAQRRERPPIDHPIARTHPERGTKALYLGNHSSHIIGMPYHEGRRLLAELEAHATGPAFVFTHRWTQGDLVMWDNRCLLHRALNDYDMGKHARVLHRTVVRGTVPV
jgi:alpha-ketoglutarate-dependent taurine dioxygenase